MPPPMMGYGPDDIFRLRKAVYGLIDAPLQWWATIENWFVENGLTRSVFDPTVFVLNDKKTNAIKGIVGVAVDDTLWGGDKEMKRIMDMFAKKFEVDIKGWESALKKAIKFLGHDITQCPKTFEIKVDQDHYIKENIKPIELSDHRKTKPEPTACTKEEIKSLQAGNGTGIWVIAQTRADVAVQISMIAGEVGREPTIGTISRFNKAAACLMSRKVTITYKRLGKSADDFELLLYHDASFGNLPKGGSQGGLILFAIPRGSVKQEDFYNPKIKTIPAVPLFWKSFRLQRVARSTFCGETLCASEALDVGQYHREFFSTLVGRHIPVTQVTDCKSLKDNVDSIVPKSTEKRLRRDLHAINEAVTNKELQAFLWADTRHQMADCLTKEMDASPVIQSFETGSLKIGMSKEQSEKASKLKKKQASRAERVRYWENWSRHSSLPQCFFNSKVAEYLMEN